MASRKTLKRPTAEALLALVKRLAADQQDRLDIGDTAILAQAEFELHGGLKPKSDYTPEFERFWARVPAERRNGLKYESQRLWTSLSKLEDWPGVDRVIDAWERYFEGVARQHHGQLFAEWVVYIALPTTWLKQRRYL